MTCRQAAPLRASCCLCSSPPSPHPIAHITYLFEDVKSIRSTHQSLRPCRPFVSVRAPSPLPLHRPSSFVSLASPPIHVPYALDLESRLRVSIVPALVSFLRPTPMPLCFPQLYSFYLTVTIRTR